MGEYFFSYNVVIVMLPFFCVHDFIIVENGKIPKN